MIYLLTIVWLACLGIALWIAALTPQASGYELSLLNAYPPLFWALTIAASICSCAILLRLAAQERQSPWWISGIAGVVGVNVFILSLPLFRGYVVSDRADALNHIGYARDILFSGTISERDFYPAMHLIQVALELLGGTTPGQGFIIINLAFAILWTVGVVMLVQQLAKYSGAVYLAAAISAPFTLLVYHTLVLPSTLSAMLLPILIALHLRRSSVSDWDRVATSITEIFLCLLLVYFHPVTTIYTIIILLAFWLFSKIYIQLQKESPRTESYTEKPFFNLGGMVGILCVALLTWLLSFAIIGKNLKLVFLWLLGEQDRESAVNEALGLMQVAGLALPDLVKVLFNSFGLTLVVVGSACLLLTVLIWCSLRRRQLPSHAHFAFAGAFLTAGGIALCMFFISSSERHPLRLLRLLVLFSLVAIAWWGWELIFRRRTSAPWPKLSPPWRLVAIGATNVLLFSLIILGQLNVFPHPRNGQPNAQVTRTEVAGMAWLQLYRTGDFMQASILPKYVVRFEAYLLGYAGFRSARENWWEEELWLPTRFYDPDWTCLAEIAPHRTTYLALSDTGRIAPLRFPEAVRDQAHQYLDQDWDRLARDPSVNKLYDSGSFEVWMTNFQSRNCK